MGNTPESVPVHQATRPMLLLAWPVVLLVGVSLWTLVLQRREMGRDPSQREWAEAQAIVLEGIGPNDVVRTAPHWAEQARAGMHRVTFDLAVRIEDEQLWEYDNLWILADAEHADEAVAALPAGYEVAESWRPSERTAVFRVSVPAPDRVLFDLRRDLAQAQVTRVQAHGVEPCDLYLDESWYCGRVDPWLRVSPSEEEVGNSLRRCVFVGMPPDSELRVAFEHVTLGATLLGHIGNTMPAIRADRGSDIDFRVEIDGQVRHSVTFGKWDQTFYEVAVDTTAEAGTPHELAFVFGAEDFFDRWVCLRARALR